MDQRGQDGISEVRHPASHHPRVEAGSEVGEGPKWDHLPPGGVPGGADLEGGSVRRVLGGDGGAVEVGV